MHYQQPVEELQFSAPTSSCTRSFCLCILYVQGLHLNGFRCPKAGSKLTGTAKPSSMPVFHTHCTLYLAGLHSWSRRWLEIHSKLICARLTTQTEIKFSSAASSPSTVSWQALHVVLLPPSRSSTSSLLPLGTLVQTSPSALGCTGRC